MRSLSGVLYMGGMLLYLRALQGRRSFRGGAVLSSLAAAFGYALSYLVLGETLSPAQMTGGALIIAGTLLVSLRPGGERRATKRFNFRLAALMLACAFTLALSSLIFKVFALSDDFWPTTFWMFVGEAVFGAGLLAVTAYRAQFLDLLRTNPGAVLSVNMANELINLGGEAGDPVCAAARARCRSLVQAIGSTTTLFRLHLRGVLLSLFFPRAGPRGACRPRNCTREGIAARAGRGQRRAGQPLVQRRHLLITTRPTTGRVRGHRAFNQQILWNFT